MQTIISPDDGALLAHGEAEPIEGGIIIHGAQFMTPPFVLVDEPPPDATPGKWRYVDGAWAAVPAPAEVIAAERASKIKAANDECDRRIGALVADYPQTEIDTFAKQESEARAFVADPAAVTPLIDALSANRGIPKAELVSRIIAKADAFAVYCGQVVGNRQRLEDVLTSAQTLEEVQAVDISARWPG